MLSPQLSYVRLKAVLAEMSYANNRRLELQTGWVLTPETACRRARAQTARLEWAFTQDAAPDPVVEPGAAGPPSVQPTGPTSLQTHQGAEAAARASGTQQWPTGC